MFQKDVKKILLKATRNNKADALLLESAIICYRILKITI